MGDVASDEENLADVSSLLDDSQDDTLMKNRAEIDNIETESGSKEGIPASSVISKDFDYIKSLLNSNDDLINENDVQSEDPNDNNNNKERENKTVICDIEKIKNEPESNCDSNESSDSNHNNSAVKENWPLSEDSSEILAVKNEHFSVGNIKLEAD